jgi:Nuclease-related domain
MPRRSIYSKNRATAAGESTQGYYEARWIRRRPRRVAIRLLVFFVPFMFFTVVLSWRNGLVIGLLAVAAEFAYVWRRHQMATSIFKSRRAARTTVRALFRLEREGYYAFHDCLLEGKDTADHILVGPTGIWLIDSETFRKQTLLWPDDDRLDAGEFPPVSPIMTVQKQAEAMAEFVRGTLGKNIDTHAILAVSGAPWRRLKVEEVGGVPVIHSRFVAAWILNNSDSIYSPEDVEQIIITVADRLSLRRQTGDDEIPWLTRALRSHRPDTRARRPSRRYIPRPGQGDAREGGRRGRS